MSEVVYRIGNRFREAVLANGAEPRTYPALIRDLAIVHEPLIPAVVDLTSRRTPITLLYSCRSISRPQTTQGKRTMLIGECLAKYARVSAPIF